MATVVFGVGYVGSRLVQELLFQGREVVAFDSFFASDRRAVDGFRQATSFRFVEGSIVDPSAVEHVLERANDVDCVYLLAAQASAHPEAASPEYTEDVNLRGPRIVLDALIRRGLDVPIVFSSSTLVYGSPLPSVVDESTPYGVFADLQHLSKCYVEKLMEMYAAVHHLRCRVVRLGLVYGVAPVMKTDPRFMTAPNLFCYRVAIGSPLEIRSRGPLAVIHVDDAVRALIWAGENVEKSGYSLFNAATSVTSIPRIVDMIRQIGESRELTVTVHDLAKTPDRDATAPVVHSALEDAGFAPLRELNEGLAETLDHFLVHGQ